MNTYLPLWTFIVLMIVTPGPGNLLIMTLGSQHGFWKSIPFNCGLITGNLLLNVSIVCGFGVIVDRFPNASTVFAYLSGIYMIWLVLRGWNFQGHDNEQPRLLGFVSGLFIHPVSPKAWVMGLLAYSQFVSPDAGVFEAIILVPLSFLIGLMFFHSFWCLAGCLLKKVIGKSLFLNRILSIVTIGVVLWAVIYGININKGK
jgi:threonine/homoserine/homoserine lactone efflux protein